MCRWKAGSYGLATKDSKGCAVGHRGHGAETVNGVRDRARGAEQRGHDHPGPGHVHVTNKQKTENSRTAVTESKQWMTVKIHLHRTHLSRAKYTPLE